MGLELAEQLGWKLPDAIFYPTGGGTGLIGMWKAFAELEALGWIGSERPRMYAVQASGCAPIVRAFEEGVEYRRALGGRRHRRRGHPRAQGGRRLPDPARGARERGQGARRRRSRDPEGGRRLRAQGRAAALSGRRRDAGGVPQALRDGEVDEDERVVLFNCATGLKYPMPPADQRARPARADRLRRALADPVRDQVLDYARVRQRTCRRTTSRHPPRSCEGRGA